MTKSVEAQVKAISAKLKKLGNRLPLGVMQELAIGALEIEGDAKASLQSGSKSGVTYEKYNPRRTHTSSAAGEAPATDTGALVNSIRVENVDDGSLVKAGGGKIDYAAFLEFGTSTILARPYMQPAFEKNRKNIFKNINRKLNEEIARVDKQL